MQSQPQHTPGSMRHYDTVVGCGPSGNGVAVSKQHSPPHMQMRRNTLTRQQSATFSQSPYAQPKLISHYSTNGFSNTTPQQRPNPRKSLAGGMPGGRSLGLRSLSQAIGLGGFGEKKESVRIKSF